MCEGGVMKNLMFANLVMQNVPRPVFLTFNSWRMGVDTPDPPPPPKQVRGLTFSHFRIDNSGLADTPCAIVVNGVPGHPIEDVVFDNIAFALPGGGTPGQAARRDIPDLVNRRPEFGVFGKEIPFAGFYLRHARGLVLRDIDLRAERPEARPALLCDDVVDLDATGLRVGAGFAGGASVMTLRNVREASVRDCTAAGAGESFVRVEGDASSIAVSGENRHRSRTTLLHVP